MSLITQIHKAFRIAEERKWDKVYVLIDLHETVIKPDYESRECYPHVINILQNWTKRDDICMIMYTCSYPEEIIDYINFFKTHNISFDYINKNPEAENTSKGYFKDKCYANILIDDKSGFDAEEDWYGVGEAFNQNCL